jgi:CRISPR-associated endoribonuclease Cas6
MTSLLSLVLSLRPLPAPAEAKDLPLPRWWGRAAYALALSLIANESPALARQLHEDSGAPKPFTVSSLWEYRPRLGLDSSAAYTLRLTALTKEPAEIFLREAREGALQPQRVIELNHLPFQILAAAAEESEHPWAFSTTYETLSRPYLTAALTPSRDISFRFASPVTFKTGGRHLPFPLPALVFRSLLSRWNAFAPLTFPPELQRFAEENLVVTRYRLSSLSVEVREGGKRIGAVGSLRFRILHYDRYWMSLLHTLAAFSLFSGIGAGTTMGLGQTRILEESRIIPFDKREEAL